MLLWSSKGRHSMYINGNKKCLMEEKRYGSDSKEIILSILLLFPRKMRSIFWKNNNLDELHFSDLYEALVKMEKKRLKRLSENSSKKPDLRVIIGNYSENIHDLHELIMRVIFLLHEIV